MFEHTWGTASDVVRYASLDPSEGTCAEQPVLHSADSRKLDLQEVTRAQARRVGLLYVVVAGYMAWEFLPGSPFRWQEFVIWALVLVAGVTAVVFWERLPQLAYASLLILPVTSHIVALGGYPEPLQYFGIMIILTNAAVGPWHGLAAAVLDAGGLALSRQLPGLVPLVPIYAIIVVTQFISFRGLYTFLEWSWNSSERANQLLAQLRESRGKLNRTLEALTEASRRLERSNRELAVARQEADEARALREQFVVNISHELRTPLNLIVGFVEMMYLSPESYEGVRWTPELVGDIGRMYRAGRHLESLISDILDLSRIDSARMPMLRELLSLRSVIDEAAETIRPLLEQRGLRYEISYDPDIPSLLIDRTRIRQVMLNLLNNAIRFTDQGAITVAVRCFENRVEVSVRDTGVGIPREQVAHIFEKFSQAHVGARSRGGAGLGLALSRQFVRLHGGDMWVESEEGQGSCFTFSLPLPGVRLPYAQDLVSVPPRAMQEDLGPVLVVDSDPGIAEMLSRYLGDRDVSALPSLEDLDEAITEQHPSAVIVNELPNASPSEWLASPGRSCERYNVPVLRCSIPSPSWLGLVTGMRDCLTKPVSREMLSRVLHSVTNPGARVLVVDDDPGFVSLMARMIETLDENYLVYVAYSGEQALDACRAHWPDLVLLDLLMPELDGFAVISELDKDKEPRDIPIVGITASSYAEELLLQRGNYFTLTQSGGLTAGKLTDLLAAVLDIVRPDYARPVKTV